MLSLATLLSAIQAGIGAIPEGLALVNELEGLFDSKDAAAIEQALAESVAAREAQHKEAQEL